MTRTKTRDGDVLHINLTTNFCWADRLRILLGCRVRQHVRVSTDLPEIGPHTITTDTTVEPIIAPRVPPLVAA